MAYNYKHGAKKESFIGNFQKALSTHKIKIAAVFAVLVVLFFFTNITGFATNNELSTIRQKLNNTEENLRLCNNYLSSKSQELYNCTSEMKIKASESHNLSITMTNLNNEIMSCLSNQTRLSSEYAIMLKNSIKYVCCRPGITTTNWNIENGSIICIGNYIFDCVNNDII